MRRGLVASREAARRAVEANRVRINGAVAQKPARLVDPGDALVVVTPDPYVGRGAHKLTAALDEFGIDPTDARCLDVGASTGGFTEVLLRRGASSVVALDVGHGQIHERVSADPRVEVMERTNMRHVTAGDLGPRFDLVVVDVSFISLRALMAALAAQIAPVGRLVALVKPQFEVGRADASRGRGVIVDPELWRSSVRGVVAAARSEGLDLAGLTTSPIRGVEGNVEFLALFAASVTDPVEVDTRLDELIDDGLAVTGDDLA